MFQQRKKCVTKGVKRLFACMLMVAMLFGLAPGAMEVKASTSVKEYNIANPLYSFTTIDEQTVTSTANGKPKLLIFFSSKCGNSKMVIQEICKGKYDYSGVDIIAPEILSTEKEGVKSIKDTYGSDDITFAYSTSGDYWEIMWNYVDSGGGSYPAMAYIDSSNQLRCVTMGYFSEEDIADNLYKYCNLSVRKKDSVTSNLTEVQMTVEYQQQEARRMLDMVNNFRQSSTWYWNADGTTKTTVSNLSALSYDYKLEQIAMKRAAEIAIHYAHERTNGTNCTEAFDEYRYRGSKGENIAAGTGNALATAEQAFTGWREEDKDYNGQGHRRNMLGVGADFTAIGIGHVYYQGNHYWAMELGSVQSGTADSKVDGKQTVSVEVKNEYIRQPLSVAMSDKVTLGESVALPTVYAEMHSDETFPQNIQYMPMGAIDVEWSVDNASIAAIEDGMLIGKALGSTTVTATAPNSGRSVTVTVNVVEANNNDNTQPGDNNEGGSDDNTGSTGGNTGNQGSTGGNTGNQGSTGGNTGNPGSTGGNTGWIGDSSNGNQNNESSGAISGVIEGSGNDNKDESSASYGTRIIKVEPTTYNNIQLSWDAVSGAKSYEIFYSTSPDSGYKKLTNTKKTFYKFSKAKCGVTYYFQMRVCTKETKSDFGPISYAKTDLTGSSTLQIKKTTYNSVSLRWSKVPGAKKYEIFYADSINGNWQSLGVKGGTSFTHKKLVTGATYYYQIRPVRDSFYGSWSNGVSASTVLDNVTNLKAKAASTDRMKLTWRKVKGAAQYVILRADQIDGTYEVIGHSDKASYVDTGLQGGTTYFYKVYAISGPYRTKETEAVGQMTKIPKVK